MKNFFKFAGFAVVTAGTVANYALLGRETSILLLNLSSNNSFSVLKIFCGLTFLAICIEFSLVFGLSLYLKQLEEN